MEIQNYREKSSEVEVVRLASDNAIVAAGWCDGRIVEEIDALDPAKTYAGINVPGQNHRAVARASEGDYIVKYAGGNFEVFKPGIFESHFEIV